MTSTREAITAVLSEDATLLATLTGGVFNSDDFEMHEGAGADIPRDSTGFVKPFAILRFREAVAVGPVSINAKTQTLEIYVYQDAGYDKIQTAFNRIYTLLQDQYITSDDRSLVHLWNIFEGGETLAEEFGDLPVQLIRFSVVQVR